jgi:hypothetical protein
MKRNRFDVPMPDHTEQGALDIRAICSFSQELTADDLTTSAQRNRNCFPVSRFILFGTRSCSSRSHAIVPASKVVSLKALTNNERMKLHVRPEFYNCGDLRADSSLFSIGDQAKNSTSGW